ncbi:hypothetical protein C8Q77DRAFT_1084793 [Trametes polyzona]|nr:hypothetical protein C8Q77DRAFT_1084793 [Trametes polyzona]
MESAGPVGVAHGERYGGRKKETHMGERRRQDYNTHGPRRVYLNGHVGAWAPRQPQWQHWGEDAERMHEPDSGAEQAAAEGAAVVEECAEACECD